MIKRILLPLDASPFTAAATEAACLLAKNQDAQITGLVVIDIPGIKKSIGPVPLGGGALRQAPRRLSPGGGREGGG